MQNTFFKRDKKLNIDITFRCALECHKCARQVFFRDHGLKVPGNDLSLENFDIITDHFESISFCGQYSDPIHHPQFIDILKICKNKGIRAEVHVASSFKSEKWFLHAFDACPEAVWIFGIDGLPNESHLYRKNQDGEKLYRIMLKSVEHLKHKPVWQYIICAYNETHINKAHEMAQQNNIEFMIINSVRWFNDDPLKPSIRK